MCCGLVTPEQARRGVRREADSCYLDDLLQGVLRITSASLLIPEGDDFTGRGFLCVPPCLVAEMWLDPSEHCLPAELSTSDPPSSGAL